MPLQPYGAGSGYELLVNTWHYWPSNQRVCVCVCDVAQPCAQHQWSSVTWCEPLWKLVLSRSMGTKMAAGLTAPLLTKYF